MKTNQNLPLFTILLILTCLSSCETFKTIVENPNSDLFDMFRTQQNYTLNEPFPAKGYQLKGEIYRNIELQKYSDNDTLYYLKYKPNRNNKDFYFININKPTADTILYNVLNKEQNPEVYKREQWLDNTLIELGIKDLSQKNKYWTHYTPKMIIVKGNLPSGAVRTGYHKEYEKFNFTTAQRAYYEQRHPTKKISGMEVLGALYVASLLSGNNKKQNFDDKQKKEQENLLYDEYKKQQQKESWK